MRRSVESRYALLAVAYTNKIGLMKVSEELSHIRKWGKNTFSINE